MLLLQLLLTLLFSMVTSLHQTWHPACPHQGHTGHSKSSLAEACFMCLCMCTTSDPLQDRMHPGDFTLLVRACTAIWICIPAEQEDSNMVMSTQWYAKNNVSNIFIYSYITGQPSDDSESVVWAECGSSPGGMWVGCWLLELGMLVVVWDTKLLHNNS